MPLFDGGDWAGFMSQFEACINYYGWTEKTKTIRLYTSIVGAARKTLGDVNVSTWTYAQLTKHMEVRYGRSKVYAQIQSELLSRLRKTGQTLHSYYDELVAASSEDKRGELIHTAFVFRLRNHPHMHRWVTKREKGVTIEAALEAAEAYGNEYGSDAILQSMPVTVNARDTTGNLLAVALMSGPGAEHQNKSVSVDMVQVDPGDGSMRSLMSAEFKLMKNHINQKFDTLDTRMQDVEKFQAAQIQRWKDATEKRTKFRDNNRAKNHNKKENRKNRDDDDDDDDDDSGSKQNNKSGGGRNDNKNQGSQNKKKSSGHQRDDADVNTRDDVGNDSAGSEE